MLIVATIFIGVTAAFHILFFKLESLDFMSPSTLKKFGVSAEHAPAVKLWAFNQGFYNLFLALGLGYALYLLHGANPAGGILLARFILLTIVGAGMVLGFSSPSKFPAAMIQATPALLGLLATFAL